ncbi:MAG: hypothetical protein QOJ39_2950, partial [Candidatus Eremiobacteraeota bacterium]|nr:hypothetical protein [Candidatus Eremiobacteraeota bacterium]
LAPGATRTLTLLGTVASPFADRFAFRLRGRLENDQTPAVALGQIELLVRSRPRFAPASSQLAYPAREPLRPSGHGDVQVVLVNEGTDVARDARLQLDITNDARIEAVDGATRVGTTLLFGDIAPGARAEATIRLRLARLVARGTAITVNGRLEAVGLLPLALAPVTIPTVAEPRFDEGASLRTQPSETVDAGESLYVRLAVRNTGDGGASRLVVRGQLAPHTAYLPGSTAVNDVPLLDVDGGSVLWSKTGLVLEDVDPGVEVVVRYGTVVNTPLAAGTLIDAHLDLGWDGGGTLAISSPAVRVRSTPAFAVRATGLPFSVSGIAPRTIDVLQDIADQRRAAQVQLPPPLTALPPATMFEPPSATTIEPPPAATVEPPPTAAEPRASAAAPPMPPAPPAAPPDRAAFRYDEEAIEARFIPAPPPPVRPPELALAVEPPPPIEPAPVAAAPEAVVAPPEPAIAPPEQVVAQEPVVPEALILPEPVVAPEPVAAQEAVVAPEPIVAPEAVVAPQPAAAPEFHVAPESVIAAEPMVAPEPVADVVAPLKPVAEAPEPVSAAAQPVPEIVEPVAAAAEPVAEAPERVAELPASTPAAAMVEPAMPDADVAAGAVAALPDAPEHVDEVATAQAPTATAPVAAQATVAPPPEIRPQPAPETAPEIATAPPVPTAQEAAAQPAAAVPAEPVVVEPVAVSAAPAIPKRVRLVFARDALERALAFLEQSDYGGLITHLFAIRTLLPTTFAGLNGDVPGKLAAEREALRGVIDRLFIKMRMPRYALTGKDLEDRSSRSALMELVRALADAQPAEDAGAGDATVVLEGAVDVTRMTPHLASLEADPLGSARPWLILAELLPSWFVSPPGGEALNAYRSALIATFSNIAPLPNEEFHRVLAGTQNAALDAALRDVRSALRDALEAAAAKA